MWCLLFMFNSSAVATVASSDIVPMINGGVRPPSWNRTAVYTPNLHCRATRAAPRCPKWAEISSVIMCISLDGLGCAHRAARTLGALLHCVM